MTAISTPNKNKYPKQSIFVVQTDECVYWVPYVEEETYYFLKTIIPNKDAKIRYTEDKYGEKNDPLNQEEQEILASFQRGEWISKEEDLDKYKAAAKQTFAKTHRINFRVSEKDFRNMQVKAREEGLPYQTLVSSIMHKYLTGRLQDV